MSNYFSKNFDNLPSSEEDSNYDNSLDNITFESNNPRNKFILQMSGKLGISPEALVSKLISSVFDNFGTETIPSFIEKGIREGKIKGKIPPTGSKRKSKPNNQVCSFASFPGLIPSN